MKKIHTHLKCCCAVFVLLFVQCGGQKSDSTVMDYDYRIAPLEYPAINSVADIAQWIDTVVVITPQITDRSLLSMIKKMLVTDDSEFIVMDKNGVYHFARDGAFVREYSTKGRGPNEYIALTDIGLEKSRGEVFILDGMNKVLVYSFVTGDFIRRITPDLGDRTLPVDGVIPAADGGFYIFSANPTFNKSDDDYHCLYKLDDQGKCIEKHLPNKDFIISMGSVNQGYEDRYLIKPLDETNISYQVSADGVKPVFWIDLGENSAPRGAIYNDEGSQDLGSYFSSRYYKNPAYLQQTERNLAFILAGPDYQALGVVYSKDRDRGFVYQSPDKKSVPFTFFAADDEFMYGSMSHYSTAGAEERADPLLRHLMSVAGVNDSDDNPKIIGVKFNP